MGRQVVLYPIPGGRLATFFAHKSAASPVAATPEAARTELRGVYGGVEWVVPRLVEDLDSTSSIYCDAESQVVMSRWSTGRVALTGDACWCVSLLAGQAASLAMAGAYALAMELASTNLETARGRYVQRMRPDVERLQRVGRHMGR